MNLFKRVSAEFLGTFWLVLTGCGSAILATNPELFPGLSIGFVGVSLAFGLSVVTMAYAVGHISGGHFNPAVTLGLVVAGRADGKDLLPYWMGQVLGAIAAAWMLLAIASGQPGFELGGFASNGFGETPGSPGNFSMTSAFLTEAVLTLFFLLVILGATDRLAPKGFAPLAIGLALTLIHLVSIPVTNTSVNPARSTGPALFVQGWALSQLWLFWAAPLIGAALAGVLHRFVLATEQPETTTVTRAPNLRASASRS